MNESDLLKFILLDIESATTDTIPVRTEGGDQPADPPEIVVSWSSTRLPNYAGHTTYANIITDSNGNATGKEFHGYFEMRADALVRHESEVKRDEILNQIHEHFLPYEHDASAFDPDTVNWQVGVSSPRDNSFVEPDWYEAGVPIRTTYMKRAKITDPSRVPDTLTTIDISVNDTDIYIGSNDVRTVESGQRRYWDTLEVDGTLTIDGTVYVRNILDSSGTIKGDGELIVEETPYGDIDTQLITITQ